MSQWTRRAVLRSGILASAAAAMGGTAEAAGVAAGVAAGETGSTAASEASGSDYAMLMAGRSRESLDVGWRFSLGNSCDQAKDFGYAAMGRNRPFAKAGEISKVTSAKFDDSAWRKVNLPHDWAVELPFNSTYPLPEQGGRPLGREFPETSIGWYRKSFTLEAADAEKRIWLEFDGIMRSADIFINGHYLAHHLSGYAPLRVDVTDWMNYAGVEEDSDPRHKTGANLLVVRCDVTMGESWFYEGAGIYRHVWLSKQPKLRLVDDGSWASSKQKNGATELTFAGEIANDSDAEQTAHVVWELLDHEGKVAATQSSSPVMVPARSMMTTTAKGRMAAAKLWSCEDPYCYTLRTRLVEGAKTLGAKTIDTTAVTFGVRTAVFDANKGFLLNGKVVKIKGTCNHQDHAGVGAALPDALNAWRLQRLKDMGSNAIRTSHNCPAPELVEAASRMGMMMMCETRMMDSSEEGLSQLTAMIRRYRNHPSVIIWSLGNEEPEQGTTRGVKIVGAMKRTAKRLDPTRPVTVAMDDHQGSFISNVVDVQGFNYRDQRIDKLHRDLPALPIVGTETASALSTRGIYKKDAAAGYVSAYDTNAPDWGNTAEQWWTFFDERPFLAGGFVWTGFDYRGEPTPYSWPCVSSHFGIMDVCGYHKDTFYYYKSWWGSEPVLHLFPHWNWEAGSKVDVWVHSNLDAVELLLNGRSLGRKTVVKNTHLSWGEVPFEAGAIEARGYKGGAVLLTARRETTGAAAAIELLCERKTLKADGMDAAVVHVSVVDAKGRTVPSAGNKLDWKVSGAGDLIGLGNGDPSSHEADKGTSRSVFNGLGVGIVQSAPAAGALVVEVSGAGLTGAKISFDVAAG